MTYRIAVLGALACMGFMCQSTLTRVAVPDADHDKTPPLIEMANIDIGGTAVVNPVAVTSNAPATVNVTSSAGKCGVPSLFVTGKATSPGAVKSLQVTITSNGSPVYDVTVTQDMDTNHTALTGISVLGKNGANGATLTLAFTNKACPQDKKFHVSAKASNFNGVTSSVDYDIVSSGISAAAAGCVCE